MSSSPGLSRRSTSAGRKSPADISDDDALARLFALNQERAKKQEEAAGKRKARPTARAST
jgi:hypothetical protein